MLLTQTPFASAILCSTSVSDHWIFSFAQRGGWPCIHHARFTEPLQSCRCGHNALVQTEHLLAFWLAGLVLEEEGKVKVKAGYAGAAGAGCWPGLGGDIGWGDGLLLVGKPTFPFSVNVDSSTVWVLSSPGAWMNCDDIGDSEAVSPTLGAVPRPSNPSSSEKSSNRRSDSIIKYLCIACTYLAHYSNDQGVTVRAIL